MELTGRLTASAEIRKTKNNKEVVTFCVAVNDCYKTKQGEKVEQTEYFQCSYWLTTKITESLQKGSIVTVSGRVYLNEYQSKDGTYHASIACHVNSIKIVATFKGKAASTGGANAARVGNAGTEPVDDMPF